MTITNNTFIVNTGYAPKPQWGEEPKMPPPPKPEGHDHECKGCKEAVKNADNAKIGSLLGGLAGSVLGPVGSLLGSAIGNSTGGKTGSIFDFSNI